MTAFLFGSDPNFALSCRHATRGEATATHLSANERRHTHAAGACLFFFFHCEAARTFASAAASSDSAGVGSIAGPPGGGQPEVGDRDQGRALQALAMDAVGCDQSASETPAHMKS